MSIVIDGIIYGLTKSKMFTVCYEYQKDGKTFVLTPNEIMKEYREGNIRDGDAICREFVLQGYLGY